jgi:hypothetical protein
MLLIVIWILFSETKNSQKNQVNYFIEKAIQVDVCLWYLTKFVLDKLLEYRRLMWLLVLRRGWWRAGVDWVFANTSATSQSSLDLSCGVFVIQRLATQSTFGKLAYKLVLMLKRDLFHHSQYKYIEKSILEIFLAIYVTVLWSTAF